MGQFVPIGTHLCGKISEGASEWKQYGDDTVDAANDLWGLEVTCFIFLAESNVPASVYAMEKSVKVHNTP